MKSLKMLAVLAALPLAVSAQDATKADPGHYKVLIDNAAVRVLKVTYAPGEKSPMHSHPDAFIVPLAAGKARFTMPDGKTQDMDLVAETPAYTPAFTHAPANLGGPIDALLVEFKSKTAGTATIPTDRPGMAMKVLAEGPSGVAYRSTIAADFHEAAGATHDFGQVVIALGAGDMMLAVDGQPTVKSWKRGDAYFIGKGVKHEAKNAGGKPVDVIIVGIK